MSVVASSLAVSPHIAAGPPLLCAIETATPVGSIALLAHGRLIGEWLAAPQKGHSRMLLTGLDSLLDAVGRDRSEITHIALSRGPGSFTGLRVGMALAKGLAQGLGVPLLPVSTLEAFARGAMALGDPDCTVAPVLDARKDEVYAAVYRGTTCVVPETVCAPEQFAAFLTGRTVLVGEGAHRYADVWRSRLGDEAICAPPDKNFPRAAFVGALAVLQYSENALTGGTMLADLTPTYIRRPEAEESERRRDRAEGKQTLGKRYGIHTA